MTDDPMPRITQLLQELGSDDPRRIVARAALDYKAAWLTLGERLYAVATNKDHVTWGFRTFKTYVIDELQLPPKVAAELVSGFEWIDQEAPDYRPRYDGVDAIPVDYPVPDPRTVGALAEARKQADAEFLSREQYEDMRDRALRGEMAALEIKRELKNVAAEERDPEVESLAALKRTLSTTRRLVDQLREFADDDARIIEIANELHESVASLVSRREAGV